MRRGPLLIPVLTLFLLPLFAVPSFAGETIQSLVLDLQSPHVDTQLRAAQILGEIGPEAAGAVPPLVKVIRSGSPEVRVVASIALLKIDPYMKDMISILLQALDSGQQVQEQQMLGEEIGLQDDALRKWSSLMKTKVNLGILPLLVQALDSNDRDIRILGVLVLGGITTRLPEGLPHLLEAYKDPDKEVRAAVVGALLRIGVEKPGVMPALMSALKDTDPEVRARAVVAMGKVGLSRKEVLPAVMGALKDKEFLVRSAAMKALESFGVAAKESAPAIAARTGEGTPEERLSAVATLLMMDPSQAPRMVPLLLVILQSPSHEIPLRIRAADLLEKTGLAGRESAALAAMMGDTNPEIRSRMGKMLTDIGGPAVPPLGRLLQNSPQLQVRTAALQSLINMRPAPPELVPVLAGALKDKDRSLRYLAADGLSRLGPAAEKAIPDLVQALKDSEESVKTSAGNALVEIGEPAVPALTEAAAQTQDPQLQARAASLLKKMRL